MFDKKYLSLTYALLIVSLVLQLISFCIFDSIEMLLLSGIICIAAFVLQFKIWENKNENIIPNIITSLVFTLICGVASTVKSELFKVGTIIFSIVALVNVIRLIMKLNVLRQFKFDKKTASNSLVSGSVLVMLVAGTLVFAEIIFLVITSVLPYEPTKIREGIEYYNSGEYEDYRFGKEAKKYFSDTEITKDSIAADFCYMDSTGSETVWIDLNTKYALKVQYPDDVYAQKRKIITDSCSDFGVPEFSMLNCYLIESEALSFGYKLFHVAALSDDSNTVIWLVIVDDCDAERMTDLDRIFCSISGTDFWKKAEKKS